MESYQDSSDSSTLKTHAPLYGGFESPLVNRCISQRENSNRNPVESILVWNRAVKIVRSFEASNSKNAPPLRSEIQSFSVHSRRRLKHTSSNAFPSLISQFGMTYHKSTPDGRTVKKHLNTFLNSFRNKYPSAGYLWILEFQSRGIPHFHLFTTLDHSSEIGRNLADIWNRIAEPDSKAHLKFHRHESNFIPWDMGSGSYLCKYLDKTAQKFVPDGFTGVGRFWGNSRNLAPVLDEVIMDDVSAIVGQKAVTHIVRTLCRHHEKSLRKSPWKSSARKRSTSYTLPNGSTVLSRLLSSIGEKGHNPPENIPF